MGPVTAVTRENRMSFRASDDIHRKRNTGSLGSEMTLMERVNRISVVTGNDTYRNGGLDEFGLYWASFDTRGQEISL